MPVKAPWPPPGGRHRATGLTGPTRRYALIVLVLAVTSSLPILAAIGPGAGSVGEALAGDDLGDTTPFIPPPSPGPVVVIPIRPGLPERPPPALATLPAPAGAAPPPRRPTRQTSAKPAAPARRTESAHRRATPKQHRPRADHRPRVDHRQHRPRVEPKPPLAPRRQPRVVRKYKLWDRPPASLVRPCRQPRWQPPGTGRAFKPPGVPRFRGR
ncbi:hypothetical protein Ais01nite_32980 [Asanoa ishikariensis]|uniref:Uncharacterized protein n=1 Tax=Asanoa ishikariensis TaxID=137265 RepID=A0A1H3UYA5_9ACTN|nr:hypothetical protein [Asanoa ishikariensis]GIF65263.1 hypothetical protein Ais01nite_32980 [Asanoa ishikariensis]SDZ66785.1 hypothetical protein SAMN05421684_8300 [Asanoa ishikariensis]